MMKQAVILAGGEGSRLRAATKGGHKSLVQVGDRALIEHQLELLASVGIDSVCIVAGYRADEVCSVLSDAGKCIVNPRYAETNSLYSLWLARDWVSGPFVLMNCDVLAHPDVFHRVLAVNGSALAYDSSSGTEAEQMKVALQGSYVRAMGKDLPQAESKGENVGILQFDERAADLLFSEADSLIAAGNENQWAPAAVSRIAPKVPIRAVDIAGLPWVEIDFPEDLDQARDQVCPAIPGCDTSQMKVKVVKVAA